MGIAMFTLSSLFAPLQQMISWFVPASPSMLRASHPALRPKATRACGEQPRAVAKACIHRPLRVLRVIEANHAPASAGRMVISGRMADVCAELDRLAELEATRH